nr:hypothetical protein BaRGS_009904 [Batillaria attramentaria]
MRDIYPDVIIGPPCTEDIASFFNIPVFGWISNEHQLDNKTRTSTLVRTLPPLSTLGNLLLEVCQRYDWHTVAMISTSGRLAEGIAEFFKDVLDGNTNFSLVRHFNRVNVSVSDERIREMYADIKQKARVIFLIIPDDQLRRYLLAAHDMGMTSGDFQFLFSRQMIAGESLVDTLRGDGIWKRDDGRDQEAKQAYKNLLYPDRYARFLHDAVYLYGLSYNYTVTRNLTPDGSNIVRAATKQHFLDNTAEIAAPTVVVTIMLAGVVVFLVLYRWWKKEQQLYRKNWRIQWSDLKFDCQAGKLSGTQLNSKLTGSRSTNNSEDPAASASNVSNNTSALSQIATAVHYCQSARLGGNRVAVRMIRRKSIRNDRKLLECMRLLTNLKHANLTAFYGVCIDPPNLCVVWEYCDKGSLQDVIHNTDYQLDSMVQFSLALDICAGLNFIHDSELKVHGNLRSSKCLVDTRWTCKLSGFGLREVLRTERPPADLDEQTRYAKLFWTAPEILRLRLKEEAHSPTQAADIYSVAIILKEIICKNDPYDEEIHGQHLTPKEIITRVSAPQGDTLFRPCFTDLREVPEEHQSVAARFLHLVNACWQEDPSYRPTSRRLLRHLTKLNPYKTTNIMDNMLKMMERYSSRLEELVAERTAQKVADDLKRGDHVQAEAFTSVTIYFSDIVGFTGIAGESTPMQIVEFLNSLYTVFDTIIQEFDVYKVETIGDAYMVVSGIPVPNGIRHAAIIADMSLALLQAVFDFTIPHQPDRQLRIRIGLNTGPVVAGVVGNIMPRYCLFGDTVNLASRMESHGLPLKIQMSPSTYEAIAPSGVYIISERGLIEVKGKGRMHTYFLEGKVDPDAAIETETDVGSEKWKNQNPSLADLQSFTTDDALTEKLHDALMLVAKEPIKESDSGKGDYTIQSAAATQLAAATQTEKEVQQSADS